MTYVGHTTRKVGTRDASNEFGKSVSLTDTYALVGMPGDQKAYLFQVSGSIWASAATYTEGSNSFGTAVAIQSTWMAVGDPGAGEVYVYEFSGGTWSTNLIALTLAALELVGPRGVPVGVDSDDDAR